MAAAESFGLSDADNSVMQRAAELRQAFLCNPHDPDRTAGGSSGGSAAAVAVTGAGVDASMSAGGPSG